MAQLGMNGAGFDADQVEPSQAFETLPAAWYNVIMSASEIKVAKSGNGEYLKCEYTIIDGQYANRKLFTNLNLWNSNPQAVEIAQRDLSAICHAVGLKQVNDSNQLHNKPLQVKVSVRPASADFEAQNDIKGYQAASTSQDAPAPMAATQAAPVPGQAVDNTPVWAKGATA